MLHSLQDCGGVEMRKTFIYFSIDDKIPSIFPQSVTETFRATIGTRK